MNYSLIEALEVIGCDEDEIHQIVEQAKVDSFSKLLTTSPKQLSTVLAQVNMTVAQILLVGRFQAWYVEWMKNPSTHDMRVDLTLDHFEDFLVKCLIDERNGMSQLDMFADVWDGMNESLQFKTPVQLIADRKIIGNKDVLEEMKNEIKNDEGVNEIGEHVLPELLFELDMVAIASEVGFDIGRIDQGSNVLDENMTGCGNKVRHTEESMREVLVLQESNPLVLAWYAIMIGTGRVGNEAQSTFGERLEVHDQSKRYTSFVRALALKSFRNKFGIWIPKCVTKWKLSRYKLQQFGVPVRGLCSCVSCNLLCDW